MSFAQRLKQTMLDRGITQTDLAKATGIGKSGISQYCSGKNIPRKNALNAIATALGVSSEWLCATDAPITRRGHPNRISVEVAAKLLGSGKQFVRQCLKNRDVGYGHAVLMPSGKYEYMIYRKKFEEETGIEVGGTQQ